MLWSLQKPNSLLWQNNLQLAKKIFVTLNGKPINYISVKKDIRKKWFTQVKFRKLGANIALPVLISEKEVFIAYLDEQCHQLLLWSLFLP